MKLEKSANSLCLPNTVLSLFVVVVVVGIPNVQELTLERSEKVPGPVCMEKGFATLPLNATQAVATVAVRIWFGSHA